MDNFFKYEKQELTVFLPEELNFLSSNYLAEVLMKTENLPIVTLNLNLNSTSFMTLPGMSFLLCFTCYLKKKNDHFKTYLKLSNDDLIDFLNTMSFFSEMNTYGNFEFTGKLRPHGNQNAKERHERKKQHKYTSVVFPLKTILYNQNQSEFEKFGNEFINEFSYFFKELTLYPRFNFSSSIEESQELFGALYEIARNINDHSHSEGFGTILASQALNGTVISFFDFGIGIIKSVLDSGRFWYKYDESEAVTWALNDRNSSKTGGNNMGTGFTIIKDFVDNKNGLLAIRTKSFIFTYKNGNLRIHDTKLLFPGTQIAIHIP